jgi:hypothetical protein
MSADDNTYNKNYHRRLAQEHAELDDPIVKAQMQLDFWWEQKLLRRALARRSEIPERGEYDEVRRFDQEMDDQQEEADRAYARRFGR